MTHKDAMERAGALREELDAFITRDGDWDTEWQADECLAAALLAVRKETKEEDADLVERLRGDSILEIAQAIRKEEE